MSGCLCEGDCGSPFARPTDIPCHIPIAYRSWNPKRDLEPEAMKELDEGKGQRFGSVEELFRDLDM